MPLSRPVPTDNTPPAPFTIDRADVAGMTPGTAHEAILGAFDTGVLAVRDHAGGMVDQALIDDAVAVLTYSRGVCVAHAPDSAWCHAEGATGPSWPCPTYREAAGVIADGLPAVVLP